MPKFRRLLPLAVLLAAGALHAAPAMASTTQQAVFEDDSQLRADPVGTLQELQSLGVTTVRVAMNWNTVAPDPLSSHKPSFDDTDPASPAYNFATFDNIIRDAQQDGITVDLMLTAPAPTWADARGEPRGGFPGVWEPSASLFRNFVQAVGRRYDGTFAPAGQPVLPRVSFWSIWNEPNYGFDIAPQVVHGVEVSAIEYRSLLSAAYAGLRATGHSTHRDTILIGETAPRGNDNVGNFNGLKPLRFLRALYCSDSHYRALKGRAARALHCPTTAGAARNFRRDNPLLFGASGFAAHLYASQENPGPPTQPTALSGHRAPDPDFADLPEVGRLESTLDRLNRVWRSHTHYRIWNTEYGYRTHPPDPRERLSQATAAYYMNWGEYISYRNPRIASYMQYLLEDPATGVFASGLLTNGKPKATFYAYRMPLYLPSSRQSRHGTLDVWGCVRPAHNAALSTHKAQRAIIEWRRSSHSRWVHVKTVTVTNPRGYFETRVHFAGSGQVRIAWAPPTGGGDYSRISSISVR